MDNRTLEDYKREITEAIAAMSDEKLLTWFPGFTIIRDPEVQYYDGELWDGDPDCKHELDPYCYSGIKCLKCRGWYCL